MVESRGGAFIYGYFFNQFRPHNHSQAILPEREVWLFFYPALERLKRGIQEVARSVREFKSRKIRTYTTDLKKFLVLWKKAKDAQKNLCQHDQRQLDRMENTLKRLENKMIEMDEAMEKMQLAVEKAEAGSQSIITLVNEIAADMRIFKNSPAKIEEFAARLEGVSENIVEAVEANPRPGTTPENPNPEA